MLTRIAGIVVVVSGLYLVGLAAAVVVMPNRAERFLKVFASSVRAHYTEQVLRLCAGVALVLYGPEMRFPELFTVFGWVLVVTSAGLLAVPWRWHQRYGEWAIPRAISHLKLFAVGAASLGVFVLYAVT